VRLEDGDACGWIGPGDRVRMAIAVFRAAGAERWLDPTTAGGEAVPGLGDLAVWLSGWPIAASSTLVVQFGEHDLVLEMSSLDPIDPLLLDGARELAEIALGRLP
jgi:hypothetical protein